MYRVVCIATKKKKLKLKQKKCIKIGKRSPHLFWFAYRNPICFQLLIFFVFWSRD